MRGHQEVVKGRVSADVLPQPLCALALLQQRGVTKRARRPAPVVTSLLDHVNMRGILTAFGAEVSRPAAFFQQGHVSTERPDQHGVVGQEAPPEVLDAQSPHPEVGQTVLASLRPRVFANIAGQLDTKLIDV